MSSWTTSTLIKMIPIDFRATYELQLTSYVSKHALQLLSGMTYSHCWRLQHFDTLNNCHNTCTKDVSFHIKSRKELQSVQAMITYLTRWYCTSLFLLLRAITIYVQVYNTTNLWLCYMPSDHYTTKYASFKHVHAWVEISYDIWSSIK